LYVNARPRLALVVEVEVRVAGTDPACAEPVDAPVAVENVLPSAAVIRAIASPDPEGVVVVGLVGKHGDPR
jgi:hypothetical protein